MGPTASRCRDPRAGRGPGPTPSPGLLARPGGRCIQVKQRQEARLSSAALFWFNPVQKGREGEMGGAHRAPIYTKINTGREVRGGQEALPALPTVSPHPAKGSGVLAEVAAAGRAVGAGLQPLHDVLEVAAVAAALAPDEEPLHHVVTDGTHAGTLPTPAPERRG